VLLPASPENGPTARWGHPTHVTIGAIYETDELCTGQADRTMTVQVVDYDSPKGRWECVVVASAPGGAHRFAKRAGDRVYRLSKYLRPKTNQKGTPP
jgi:hypothetical protein